MTTKIDLTYQVKGALPVANAGVPPAGLFNQVLTKIGPADYAVGWMSPSVASLTGTMADFDAACTDGNFVFQNQAAAVTTLNAIGAVTFGTTLHVQGQANFDSGVYSGTANDVTLFGGIGVTRGIRIAIDSTVGAIIEGRDSSLAATYQPLTLRGSTVTLAFGTSPALTVDTTGRVGIGTTGPGSDLDVSKTVANGNVVIRVSNLSAGGTATARVSVLSASASFVLSVNEGSGTPFGQWVGGASMTAMFRDFSQHVWRSATGTEWMRLNASGNLDVLIGSITCNSLSVRTGGSVTLVGTTTLTAGGLITANGGLTVGASGTATFNGPVVFNSTAKIGALDVGYLGIPQVFTGSLTRTFALTDNGKAVAQSSGAATWTIPDNATVPFPIGATIRVLRLGGTVSVALTAGVTLTWVPTGATGARTVTGPGYGDLYKVNTDAWYISGPGVS